MNKNLSARPSESRLFFIDNLRIFLTVVVVLHHVALVYCGSAPFYYSEPPGSLRAFAGFNAFMFFNQAYFMGFFFLLSGYFVPGSFDRHGAGKYLVRRLIRLGIPLIVFTFILNPLASLGSYRMPAELTGITRGFRFSDYPKLLGFGPLWFAEMLLLFDFGYTLLRLITRNRRVPRNDVQKFPGIAAVGISIIVLAGVSFLLRIIIPMGFTVPVLGFPTFAYFPQYLGFFIFGILAYRRGWFRTLPKRLGIIGLGFAAAASVLLFPLALTGNMFSLQLNASSGNFVGNGSWQSAVYALWDSAFSIGFCLALLVLFRGLFNRQGALVRSASAASYGVYILHVLVIVFFAVLLRDAGLAPAAKFFIISAAAVSVSFTLAWGVRKIPGVVRII